MGALVLVLWALLMSAECAGSPTGPGENLSCYQCFKVPSQAFCTPTACASTDRVCVSNAVIFTLSESLAAPNMIQTTDRATQKQAAQHREGLGVKILLSKRCAPRCPNTNMKFEWLSGPGLLGQIIRQCCLGSLCNGAPTPQESPWALPRGLLLQMGLGLLRALL
ncbi:lymphocyte antigen 6L [Camelus ferus]|uniref:Lymphocyte antigen 6L n=1 Tax=Camelus ferus TaxID=419612 RepID=A0A8B8S0Q2_CAMFR|nr:lymphocyte antigen 6L [Camelus ferus]